MPTYEYRCRECGHGFEVFQRMSDAPAAVCTQCGAGAERLMSGGAGLLFKGEGFYITDYRSDDYKKKAGLDSGGADGKPAEDGKPGVDGKPVKEDKAGRDGAKDRAAKAKPAGSAAGTDKNRAVKRSGRAANAPSGTGRKGGEGE